MTHFSLPIVGNPPNASCARQLAARATTACVVAALALSSHAQTPSTAPPQHANPATPAISANTSSGLAYKSVFERYRSFRDESVGSWREANETVTRVGGWREYLKEAQRPEAAQDGQRINAPQGTSQNPTPSPASSVKTDPHAGHGGKK